MCGRAQERASKAAAQASFLLWASVFQSAHGNHHLRRLHEMLRGPARARVSAKFGKIRSFRDTTALIAVLAAAMPRRRPPTRSSSAPRRCSTASIHALTQAARRHADARHAACNSWPPFFAEISGCIAEPPREHRESLRGKVVHWLSLLWRRVIVQLTMTASDRPRIQPCWPGEDQQP
jgi:hypothetical protein